MAEAPTTPTPEASPLGQPAAAPAAAPVPAQGALYAPPTPPSPDPAAPAADPPAGGETTVAEDPPKAPEGDPADDKTKSETPAVPVTLADLKLPDGAEATPGLEQFATFATEAGLDKDRAQGLLDLHFKELQSYADAQAKAWTDTIEGWKTAISADPEIGGEKTKEVQTVLGRALDEYGSQDARDAFNATGAGWNPAIVKFVLSMAKKLTEGRPAVGAPRPIQKAVTPSERLYGQTETTP